MIPRGSDWFPSRGGDGQETGRRVRAAERVREKAVRRGKKEERKREIGGQIRVEFILSFLGFGFLGIENNDFCFIFERGWLGVIPGN